MKRYYFIGLFLFFLLFFPRVNASLGVSPAYYEVDFEPGLTRVFTFDFFSDEESKLMIYTEGDLSEYVDLSVKELRKGGRVNALLRLPARVAVPGTHRLLVGAKQVPEEEGGFALFGNIRAVIKVHVPYPGKYAEAALGVKNVNAGQPIPYEVSIQSLGSETIQTVSYIELVDVQGTVVLTHSLGTASLQSNEDKQFKGELESESLKSGDYMARLVVTYAEEKVIVEQKVRVGELYVRISNSSYWVNRGSINSFELELESFWNDPLDGVYVSGNVTNSSVSFVTSSISLEGFSKTKVIAYFDPSSLSASTFSIDTIIHYAGKTTEQSIMARFRSSSSPMLYVAVFVVLLVVVIAIIIILRRKRKK